MDKYFEKYRIRFLVVFIIMVLSIILLTIDFWNINLNPDREPGASIIIFLIICLAAAGGIFDFYRKATNEFALEEHIKALVAKNRNELLESLQSENEDENEVVQSDEEFQKSLHELIPKGNFKKYDSFTKAYLGNIANKFELVTGLAYLQQTDGSYKYICGFGLPEEISVPDFSQEDGLCGQVAKSKRSMLIDDVPEHYFQTESGLGKSKPKSIFICPILINDKAPIILELGFFTKLHQHAQNNIRLANELFAEKIYELINT